MEATKTVLRLRGRKIVDRIAAGVVTTGGLAIIASVIGLLLLFVFEIAPMWRQPRVRVDFKVAAMDLLDAQAGRILVVDCEEYQRIGVIIAENGTVLFYNLSNRSPLLRTKIELAPEVRLTSAVLMPENSRVALGTSAGDLLLVELDYGASFQNNTQVFTPSVATLAQVKLDENEQPIENLAVAGSESDNLFAAAITSDTRLVMFAQIVSSGLFGGGETEQYHPTPSAPLTALPTALAIDRNLRNLYVGFENGYLSEFRLDDPAAPVLDESLQTCQRSISFLGLLIGDRSLVIGDASGKVNVWFDAFDADGSGTPRLRRAHTFAGHQTPVTCFAPSQRNRTFITGSNDGELIMHYSTNERTLFRGDLAPTALILARMAPRGDGAFIVDEAQNLTHLRIDNPHPEANWRTFFGKVWYEGYSKPDYVWQSSGGTDDFEPKLSLVPLIFGTLKGTVYALMIALPLGIFSALFVSQFMHPMLRGVLKPTMEIMAALPSVVLGFIAGLWLAPRIQPVIPGVFVMLFALPAVALLAGWLWQHLPRHFTRRFTAGAELIFLIPVLAFAVWLCLDISPQVEAAFFGGDFQKWLLQTVHLSYDQRNAFVVGIVMGFAVIPIIFTIAEDALSNVPHSLTAASLALGATQWQTAVNIVLPAAIPGIFSAAMIGLGRAVGETMIVLMATGNTPLLDWNIFNGFRTLAANIAVEIPEAPLGGTLYRSLFLAALILFLMTFVVNTLADIIRQRIKMKFENF